MKNKWCFYLMTGGLLLCSTWIRAQEVDFEKEFEAFQAAHNQEFDDFKNKADAEFEIFLRETWVRFDASSPEAIPVRPEPIVQPIQPQTIAPQPPVEIKPVLPPIVDKPAPGVYIPGQPYIPVQIDKPAIPVKPVVITRAPIEFYGTMLPVSTAVIEDFALPGICESDVANAWGKLCKADYEQLINDCMTLREEKKMNDWAYIQFTKKLGEQLYGSQQTNEVAFLQMFLLNKSGYKVRLAKINDQLRLMIAPAGSIYGLPFVVMDGAKYYIYGGQDLKGALSVHTYKQDFANAKNFISLDIDELPVLSMVAHEESVAAPSGKVRVESVVNKNLINFYKEYPQCNVAVYYHTPMSNELKEAIYPSLQTAIAGKSQVEAANLLIDFVQSGFKYQTDGEQFGYEKPFFIDENFFYPASDCEDRSILYATLVKDLLGLDAVLLDYPNHIATAVRFTDDVQGDYVLLDGGNKYLICDPTYVGASIGKCMPNFKNVSPEIIR